MQRNGTARASPMAVQTARYTPWQPPASPSTQKKKVTVPLQGESIVKAQLLNLIPATSVTSSSIPMWGGVLGVMLGVTMTVLCHQSQRLSRNPHSTGSTPAFLPILLPQGLIWKLNFISTQNGGVTAYGTQPPAPPQKQQAKSLTNQAKQNNPPPPASSSAPPES